MNADGSKLSKRQNDIKLEYYRTRGYFPQALLNYITQAGGGFKKEIGEKLFCFDMKQLTEKFDISRVNSNSSRLNPELLNELNQLELAKKLENPNECKVLIQNVRDLIKAKYPLSADQLDLDDDHIFSVLKWAIKRIHTVNELTEEELSFLWVLPKLTKDKEIELNEGKFFKIFTVNIILIALNSCTEIIDSLVEELKDEKFTKQNLQNLLKEFSTERNLTFANFMKNLRTMLSGLKEGPGVAEMMEILGKEDTLERIERLKRKTKVMNQKN
jgi:glutamyl-tRNA synthetase